MPNERFLVSTELFRDYACESPTERDAHIEESLTIRLKSIEATMFTFLTSNIDLRSHFNNRHLNQLNWLLPASGLGQATSALLTGSFASNELITSQSQLTAVDIDPRVHEGHRIRNLSAVNIINKPIEEMFNDDLIKQFDVIFGTRMPWFVLTHVLDRMIAGSGHFSENAVLIAHTENISSRYETLEDLDDEARMSEWISAQTEDVRNHFLTFNCSTGDIRSFVYMFSRSSISN